MSVMLHESTGEDHRQGECFHSVKNNSCIAGAVSQK